MVEYITINGVKYPVIINFYVIGEFQKETGYSFDALATMQHSLFLVEPLLWHSLKLGHLVSKIPFELKREDMPILLSDNNVYEELFETITKFFPEQKEGTKASKKK